MPITRELENIEELEAVNFNHEQAKALAKIIECSHADSHENLKEFISAENKSLVETLRSEFKQGITVLRSEFKEQITTLRSEFKEDITGLRSELKENIKDLEIRMAYSQKDLLLKIFAIISGTSAMLFAAIKLFG
ncbi:MAG: hypothetical protein GY775_02080 [Candidatus Scalindua sp.]|nr:hypothetical protein [Candidatus Scalindua sp.]